MDKKKDKKDIDKKKIIKIVLIVCGILIIILFLLIMSLKNSTPKNETKEKSVIEQEEYEAEKDYVRNRGEKERVEYYLAEYIRAIEKGNYEKAYNRLYPEFRENYFDTIEVYEKYVKSVYSDLMAVEYVDIQRQGTYYILTVKITNLQTIETTIEQIFVIHELGLNDYQISFQVKR